MSQQCPCDVISHHDNQHPMQEQCHVVIAGVYHNSFRKSAWHESPRYRLISHYTS